MEDYTNDMVQDAEETETDTVTETTDEFPAASDAEEPEAEATAEVTDDTEYAEEAPEKKHKQSADADRVAADARRAMKRMKDEMAETERKLREAETILNDYRGALQRYNYGGSDKDNIATLIAQAEGKQPEEVKQRLEVEEKQREERINNDPRVIAAERYKAEQEASLMEQRDLMEIKSAFPLEKATRMDDISNAEAFNKYRFHFDANGNVTGLKNSAADAYRLANQDIAKPKVAKPNDKEHMIAPDGVAGKDVLREIPKDEMDTWRMSYPDLSQKELKEKYNKAMKLIGG